MTISSTLLIYALLAPPSAVPASDDAVPASDYAAAIAEMTALSERINFGEPVNEDLLQTLAKLPRYTPELAADHAALELRTQAQLQLARAALSNGDRDTAVWIVDEAIRSAMGVEVVLDGFGPSLGKLYNERREAMASAGRASLEVRCVQPCRVFVNEHESPQRVEDLPLGVYRLWIEGTHPLDPGHVRTEIVILDLDAELVTRVFDSVLTQADAPEPQPGKQRGRVMPRGVESVLLAVGVGLASAGALMLGIDPGQGELAIGGTLVAIGGAAAIVGGVTLGVDEVRIRKANGRQAMVVWTLRF
jgi:hypothetical protein